MRFPKLTERKQANCEQKTVTEFDLGINDEAGVWASDDCVLAESVNMTYENDVLKTRSGIRANENSLVSPAFGDDRVYLPFTVTSTVYYKNGVPYNIAYSCTGDISLACLKISLVNSSGNVLSAGDIFFTRVDYETFNLPVNVSFAVASPVSGIGVFAFIERHSINDTLYEVYEAQENFASWRYSTNDTYVPTVLVNGRGERYEQAHELGDFSYPDPEQPEDLNLLSDYFKCYFTSDGLSSYFRLPYGHLGTYSALKCRLYSSGSSYTEWNIGFDSTYNTQTVDGQQITLFVDKTLGILRFCTATEDYHVPIMSGCPLNNIMVKASSSENSNAGAIFSSSGIVSLDNRLYVYGNTVNPNCIYCAKTTNPLYFPESSKLFIGDGSSAVTALRVQNGKLIAFKPGETYKVTTALKSETGKKAVLPEKTLYFSGDILSAQTIDNKIGCPSEKTLSLCGSRLVWLGGDNNVYALATTTYGNTTNIYKVSQPLGDRLKDALNSAQTVFAVTDGGKYLLAVDKQVFVMNYRVRGFGYSRTYYSKDDTLKSPAWFVWKLSESSCFYDGAQVSDRAVFITNFRELYFYISAISGESDAILACENGENTVRELPIASSFKTKSFDFGSHSRKKRISGIIINGSSPDTATLTVYAGKKNFSLPVTVGGEDNSLNVSAGIPSCAEIAAGFSCDKPFNIRSIVFLYKPVSIM